MKQIITVSLTLGLVLSGSSKLVIAAESKANNNNTTYSQQNNYNNHQVQLLDFIRSQQLTDAILANNPIVYKAPKPKTKDPRIEKIKFDFDNSYDYGACLDSILLAYEQRMIELENSAKNKCTNNIFSVFGNKLSKDIALQLIYAANFHATQGLEDKLYPSLGLRRRVAINLGYVYEIDRQNKDILKYINTTNK